MKDLRLRMISVLYGSGDMPADKAARLTDALIHDLGIKRVDGPLRTSPVHRYVTEWIADAD